jgi:Mg2+-importing ATPase
MDTIMFRLGRRRGGVDVACGSAEVILLRRDLDVLRAGMKDGRWAFVNTPKYVSITNSASFGDMVSMVLPTPPLPLAAKQILLNNFLCDLPSIAISSDNVDPGRFRRFRFTVIVIGYIVATEVAKIWFFQSS